MENLPAHQEDPTCDAILGTQSMISSVDDMKRDAHDELEQTLEEGELEVREVMRDHYVGNPRGPGLASLPERLHIVEEENAGDKAEIAELKHYVSILRIAGPDYKRVRNRFLSVFKWDKIEVPLKQSDRNFIAEGNVVAHSGDAAIDVLLYDGAGGRQDWYVLEELYGLHPSDVRKITHKETIEILNLNARVKANEIPGANEFCRRFRVFIVALRMEDPGFNYLQEDLPNPTCAAYWSLREVHI
ncbi:unnamed protein product [Tuber aestivum]|uniref:Uncharacterized protein n=1 Tax=Tuber aestivum TaxID=59557 RepID=A0A292PKC3_9PEZI|nr:unnamed protein product [Tuber aestivum]